MLQRIFKVCNSHTENYKKKNNKARSGFKNTILLIRSMNSISAPLSYTLNCVETREN